MYQAEAVPRYASEGIAGQGWHCLSLSMSGKGQGLPSLVGP